jgi:MFS transporter, SP family, sugar:H+ symporter
MYQGESSPAHVRGAIVCCYQLFITIGIIIAYLINFGTESIQSPASWRIVMGISFIWAFVLGFGILLFPETPRFDYRQGKTEKAAETISKFYGIGANHHVVRKQMKEMEEKFQAEEAGGDHPWYEVFTGPRMLYRVLLGMTILALQQLTGVNYFCELLSYFNTCIGLARRRSFGPNHDRFLGPL